MGLGVEAELVCPPGLGGETGPEDGPAEGLCTLEALYPLHWPVHHPAPLLPQNVHSVRIWIPQLHILIFVHKVLIHVELQKTNKQKTKQNNNNKKKKWLSNLNVNVSKGRLGTGLCSFSPGLCQSSQPSWEQGI